MTTVSSTTVRSTTVRSTTVGVRVSRTIRRATELVARLRPAPSDRGDVPGWVLITVMTAGLVSALWLVANQQLAAIFERAVNAVTGP
jgi:hypothetical protein